MPDATDETLAQSAAPQQLQIPAEKLPLHIAIIMDGNGRWAQAQGKARVFGHREGAESVRAVLTECGKLGIKYLTLYSFSIENWKRPQDEVNALMELLVQSLVEERDALIENQVRLVHLGRRDGLPDHVLDILDETIELSKSFKGITLALALNYGARAELVDATRAIAEKVRTGELDAAQIDEQTISSHLYSAGIPDPDLLIRTAGEMRVSNYLLWQISYAELYVTDMHWPDFRVEALHDALREYARRQRRFGAIETEAKH